MSTTTRDPLPLSHFSNDPHISLRSIDQEDAPTMKPAGLWVSVDGEYDWPTWNDDAQFLDTSQQYRFRVTLDPTARILHLNGYTDLVHFTRQYGMSLSDIPDVSSLRTLATFIDWKIVADQHDGIIISPYIWPARTELIWYYGWDCASGCIWNAHAITSITPTPTTTPARNPT